MFGKNAAVRRLCSGKLLQYKIKIAGFIKQTS